MINFEGIFKPKSGIHLSARNISKRFKLTPGNYIIVPNTLKPNTRLRFWMRLFTEAELTEGEFALDDRNDDNQDYYDNDYSNYDWNDDNEAFNQENAYNEEQDAYASYLKDGKYECNQM